MKKVLMFLFVLVGFTSIGFSQCNGNICKSYNSMVFYSGSSLTLASGSTFSVGADIALTGDFNGAIGTFSGTLDVDGQATFGADGTVSTVTALGVASFHGALTGGSLNTAGNLDVDGNAYIGDDGFVSTFTAANGNLDVAGDLAVSGSITGTGGFFPVSKTQAEIEAITSSSVGEMYICSDCTVTLVCGSSEVAKSDAWVSLSDIAVACD